MMKSWWVEYLVEGHTKGRCTRFLLLSIVHTLCLPKRFPREFCMWLLQLMTVQVTVDLLDQGLRQPKSQEILVACASHPRCPTSKARLDCMLC